MLVMLRHPFFSDLLSQSCLTDNEATDYFFVLVSNITSIHTKVATVCHGADGLHIFTEANVDIDAINRVNTVIWSPSSHIGAPRR